MRSRVATVAATATGQKWEMEPRKYKYKTKLYNIINNIEII